MKIFPKEIIVSGLRVRYYTSEKVGPNPFVFLHGWQSNALSLNKTLEKCNNFVSVDLPGFGESEYPEDDWGIYEYAEFLDRFLEKIGVRDSVIAGHSFGGSVAAAYCARYGKARKLVLIDSAGMRRKNNLKKIIFLVFSKAAKLIFLVPGVNRIRESFRKKFYDFIGSEDYVNSGMMAGIYKKIIKQDIREDLKRIEVPTLLIWGENDEATPVSDARFMEGVIRDSELVIIPGAGHYVFLDKQDEFEKIFFSAIR